MSDYSDAYDEFSGGEFSSPARSARSGGGRSRLADVAADDSATGKSSARRSRLAEVASGDEGARSGTGLRASSKSRLAEVAAAADDYSSDELVSGREFRDEGGSGYDDDEFEDAEALRGSSRRSGDRSSRRGSRRGREGGEAERRWSRGKSAPRALGGVEEWKLAASSHLYGTFEGACCVRRRRWGRGC